MVQVRQFPDGAEAGLSKATAFMESGEWERNLEGLELIVSLARGHAEVNFIISEKKLNYITKSVNLLPLFMGRN